MKAKRLFGALAAAAMLAALVAAPAQAEEFGVAHFDATFVDEDGASALLAGSHPFAFATDFVLNSHLGPIPAGGEDELPDGDVKDITVAQLPGLVPDLTAIPQCTIADFISTPNEPPACSPSTAVGHNFVRISGKIEEDVALYNLIPPPGVPLMLGFEVLGVPVTLQGTLNQSPPYNGIVQARNVLQVIPFLSSEVTAWGVPAAAAHDEERGFCVETLAADSCPANAPELPFLTAPRACLGPLATSFETDSWQEPGAWITGSVLTHNDAEPPEDEGFTGCGKLGFSPSIVAQPTTKAAQSPTGLDLNVEVADEDLVNPNGFADSDIRKVILTLPEGMTANPSVAEGLEVCSETQLANETLASAPGEGCPPASKIGTVEVRSPLVEQSVAGDLYVADPYKNPFGSLLAFYLVLKNKDLGIIVKQAVKVEPDPQTGRLISITDEIPQLPFSSFKVHLREGGRSPLISPPLCGTFDGHDAAHEPIKATFFPYAGGEPVTATSDFELISGPNEGDCPPGGKPPFNPGFQAGSLNAGGGKYAPFYVRLTRKDGEQDMTKISAVLPPGLTGKLAGLAKCPEAAIAAAKAKTGLEERANPSCPESSRIGRTSAGAGVGSQLTYAPGSLYLAGPYHGDPLSIVAIVPAVAGPFDVGNVVVRQALTLDPVTAQVQVDGAASDPLPHILAGIPLNVREIEVYADRPEFSLNPTSCARFETRATLWGSNLLPLDPADDQPVALTTPYQAVNCARLRFGPRLDMRLRGRDTRRGGNPALHAVYRAHPGHANLRHLALSFPRSEFVDQSHFRTICTRVQFAAGAGHGAGCPKGSIYGRVRAFTPLLDEALEGPVYLRSSSHNLPDAVFVLHGIVDAEVAVTIDSVHGHLRATIPNAPDVPVSKAIVDMQGGEKGLFVNSVDICRGKHRARAQLKAQSGRAETLAPIFRARCGRRG